MEVREERGLRPLGSLTWVKVGVRVGVMVGVRVGARPGSEQGSGGRK